MAAAPKTSGYEGMDIAQVKHAIEADVRADAVGKTGFARSVADGAAATAAGLLEKAKGASPASVVSAVESAHAKVVGAVPASLVEKGAAVTNSMISGIDSGLDGLSLKINEVYKLSPTDYMNYMTVRAGEWKSWGVELMHFNLIGYCKEVASRTTDAAKPMTDPVQQRVAAAVVELEKAKASLQEALDKRKAASKDQMAAVQADVKTRLDKLSAAAGELAAAGSSFVEKQKERMPEPAKKSVEYIKAAPASMKQMSEEIKAKAGEASNAAIEKTNGLMLAIKEVLYAHVVQSTAEQEKADPAAVSM